MQCREVSNQIQRILQKQESALDESALAHLKACPKCQKEFIAVQALNKSCETISKMPEEEILPLNELKNAVLKTPLNNKSSFDWTGRRFGKPVLSFSLATFCIIFCLFALIPFEYSKTIGYEVSFAGVDKNIVEEDNFICDVLHDLGLLDADIDIQGCNVTCSLLIIDLKSKEEADKVVEAFSQINDHDITSNVIPIKEDKSATLLDRANDNILK